MSFPIDLVAFTNDSNGYSRFGLMPGKWVVFGPEESISKELVGPFKVINRDDAMGFDMGRCFLMNVEGKLIDYCPMMCRLDYKDLPWGYKVKVLSKEEITQIFDGKLEELQSKAIGHLKSLAQGKYFGKGFDPDNENITLSGEEIREKYGLTLR